MTTDRLTKHGWYRFLSFTLSKSQSSSFPCSLPSHPSKSGDISQLVFLHHRLDHKDRDIESFSYLLNGHNYHLSTYSSVHSSSTYQSSIFLWSKQRRIRIPPPRSLSDLSKTKPTFLTHHHELLRRKLLRLQGQEQK